MPYIKSEYSNLDKYQHSNDCDFIYFKKGTDIFHNPYGAAIIGEDGYKEYWIENKLHRLDGPAIIYPNGDVEYYINGKELSKKEFEMHPKRLKFLGKEHLTCLI